MTMFSMMISKMTLMMMFLWPILSTSILNPIIHMWNIMKKKINDTDYIGHMLLGFMQFSMMYDIYYFNFIYFPLDILMGMGN